MKKILVIVDMQNDFITGALGTKEAQDIVPKIVEKVKNFDGYKLYTTMDTHDSIYLDTQEGKNLPIKHCIKSEIGWRLHQDIIGALEELGDKLDLDDVYDCFEKEGFGSTELIEQLQFDFSGHGENEFEAELVGVCTDICVISNAILLKTYFPELKITVDSGCCAGVTPESHKNALEAMKMCQINII